MSATNRFRDLHWGLDASFLDKMVVPEGKGRPVAELAAISYTTRKKNEQTVYRHAFDKLNGRGHYLLQLAKNGSVKTPQVRRESAGMGRVIDMELVDGRVVDAPFCWILTWAKDGKTPVLLGSPYYKLNFAIEQRSGKPYIAREGIVG